MSKGWNPSQINLEENTIFAKPTRDGIAARSGAGRVIFRKPASSSLTSDGTHRERMERLKNTKKKRKKAMMNGSRGEDVHNVGENERGSEGVSGVTKVKNSEERGEESAIKGKKDIDLSIGSSGRGASTFSSSSSTSHPSDDRGFYEDGKDEIDEELNRAWYDAEEEAKVMREADFQIGMDAAKRTRSTRDIRDIRKRWRKNEPDEFSSSSSLPSSLLPLRENKMTVKNEYGRDLDKWEESRLILAGGEEGRRIQAAKGVAFASGMAQEDGEDDEERFTLAVLDERPSFLTESDVTITGAFGAVSGGGGGVSLVKDPSSDIAILSKKGSPKLKEMRASKMRREMRRKEAAELVGESRGVGGGGGESREDGGERFDHRKSSQYLRHIQNKSTLLDTSTRHSSSSNGRSSLRRQRESLPIFGVKEDLLQLVRENQVVVVVGETGSGKTTQLPQYLLDYSISNSSSTQVVCTQPRRVAAVSVAKRVAEERGVPLGGEVGYAIRFEDCTTDETHLKYCTDGILLRECIRDSTLDKYGVVILDEAHERSLNTDVLLGVVRRICTGRSDIKVVVTSATLDAEKFSKYYGNCAVFRIPGRTFPVETLYTKAPCTDYVAQTVKQIITVHLSYPTAHGDILVFMTGQDDIEAVCELVAEGIRGLTGGGKDTHGDSNRDIHGNSSGSGDRIGDGNIASSSSISSSSSSSRKGIASAAVGSVPPMLLLPIYSQLPSDLQAMVFRPPPPGGRKCVVATNIAETSLTIDGIAFVIDCGFCKLKSFNPKIGMDALTVAPISCAAAEQRKGRAGRTRAGMCWRMYTEYTYTHDLYQMTIPEIRRANLGNVILQLKTLGVATRLDIPERIIDFDFIDPPPIGAIAHALFHLWDLNAIDGRNANLTAVGEVLAEFPLEPALSKMLVVSALNGCSVEVVTIAAMLSVPAVFYRPVGREEESDSVREKFFVPESDHLTLLFTYQQWEANYYSATWCTEHFIHSKAMKRVREIREQIIDLMRTLRVPLISCGSSSGGGSNWDLVRKTVASSYFFQAARMKSVGEYFHLRTGMPAFIHPTSAIAGLGMSPEYVIYHELVYTSKQYMRHVTAVLPEWLAEVAPHVFKLISL